MKKILNFPFILVTLFILRIVFSFLVWHPDLNNHSDWGIRFFEYGAKDFYAPESNVWSYTWPNQPPGTIYMFAGARILFEFVFNIFWKLNVSLPVFPSIIVSYFETNLYPAILKLPAILADFGIAYLIYRMLQNKEFKLPINVAKMAAVIWLINPAVWYNSTIWGQYDAVINFFALLSFYLLTKRNLSFSLLALTLSVYIKASLLIFVPIWFTFVLAQKYEIKKWLVSVGLSVLVLCLLTLPFADKNVVVWLYELYTKKIFVQQLHVITANAFNLWSAIAGIHERPDTLPFVGLNYQIWSYIFFAISYIPLLVSVFKRPTIKNLVWVIGLAAFSSFVLLTNMHERYLYPLFPYLTIIFALKFTDLWSYSAISLISLLNLYNFWFVPVIAPIVSFLSFGDRLIPRVLGLIMFGLYLRLYLRYTGSK